MLGASAGAIAAACGSGSLEFDQDSGEITAADASETSSSADVGTIPEAASDAGADSAAPTDAAADAGPSPIAINEVSGNSPDYVELFNRTAQPIALTGYSVTIGGTAVALTKTIAANGYYVIALKGATCAAAPPCDAAPLVGVSNAAGGEAVKLSKGAMVLEQVQYPGGLGAGMSWSRSPNGSGNFSAKATTQGTVNP